MFDSSGEKLSGLQAAAVLATDSDGLRPAGVTEVRGALSAYPPGPVTDDIRTAESSVVHGAGAADGALDLDLSRAATSVCPDGPPPESGWWLDRLRHPESGPVSWLAELAPSGLLLTELEQLPEDVIEDDWDHVEMVAHWHRMEAYCAARKRLAAATLARRQSMAAGLAALRDLDGGMGIASSEPSIAADEIGLRLGVGTRAARRLVRSGQALGGVGLPVAEALAAGDLDAGKADMILDAVADLAPDAALEVQAQVIDRAGHLPSGSVRRALATACAAIDPDRHDERAQVAAAGRRVCRPRALPHGMAALYAELPAYEATQLYRTLDAAARTAKSTGDARTMDQLRADALALLGLSALHSGWIGTPPAENPDRGADHDAATHESTPRRVGDAARRTSRAHRMRTKGRRRRRPPTLPGPRQPMTPVGPAGPWTPRGPDRAHLAGLSPPGGPPPPVPMRIGTIGGRSAHVRVVVPLHTLMGAGPPGHVGGSRGGSGGTRDSSGSTTSGSSSTTTGSMGATRRDGEHRPAYLEGYGPIPDLVARAIAAGSVWRRLVLDPMTSTVRELGTTRYRPPASMAELVRAEKPECVLPGCTVPADSCDLDHRIPYPLGTTGVSNLDPLCRRHHLLVTHAGWARADVAARGEEIAGANAEWAVMPGTAPGARAAQVWITTAGRRYTERRDGALTPERRREAVSGLGTPDPASAVAPPPSPQPGPPPF